MQQNKYANVLRNSIRKHDRCKVTGRRSLERLDRLSHLRKTSAHVPGGVVNSVKHVKSVKRI